MAEPNLYHLQAADVRSELADVVTTLKAVRVGARATIALMDEALAAADAMLARVNVELN